jgi:hypothetical protein
VDIGRWLRQVGAKTQRKRPKALVRSQWREATAAGIFAVWSGGDATEKCLKD